MVPLSTAATASFMSVVTPGMYWSLKKVWIKNKGKLLHWIKNASEVEVQWFKVELESDVEESARQTSSHDFDFDCPRLSLVKNPVAPFSPIKELLECIFERLPTWNSSDCPTSEDTSRYGCWWMDTLGTPASSLLLSSSLLKINCKQYKREIKIYLCPPWIRWSDHQVFWMYWRGPLMQGYVTHAANRVLSWHDGHRWEDIGCICRSRSKTLGGYRWRDCTWGNDSGWSWTSSQQPRIALPSRSIWLLV